MSAVRKKVLYIEDDLIYSQYALDLFRELEPSFDIFHVGNGAMAWAVLEKGYRPDVIISDIKMPKMDGYALLARVKETAELHDIPFVLLSDGHGDEPAAKGNSKLAADQNMIKPYSTEQFALFMEKIRSACDQTAHGFRSAAVVTV